MKWNLSKKQIPKFFVSVGSGINQIPLIEEAARLGFIVIGIDGNILAPGFIKCDLKIQESIADFEEIYQKLRELMLDGEIRCVMTKSYGEAVKTASFLASRFGTPFIPFERAEDFIDKRRMKAIFRENGLPTPRPLAFRGRTPVDPGKEEMFPLIAKPVVGHAKTEVHVIKDMADLKKYISRIADREGYIFEKYIPGEEIIAIGIVNEKKFHLADITDKTTLPYPSFVDIRHVSPSKHYGLADEIARIGQGVADAFGIDTSPLIMEMIVDAQGGLHLIEAVPEFGGEFLADVLVPSNTGYPLLRETIKAVAREGFRPPLFKKPATAVAVKYIVGTKGTLSSFNPDGPKRAEGVIFHRIFKDVGGEVKPPQTNHDRIGVVIARGHTVEEAVDLAEKAEASFDVRIKPPL